MLIEERCFRISLGDIEKDLMPTAQHEAQESHRQIGTSWRMHREGSSVPLPNSNRHELTGEATDSDYSCFKVWLLHTTETPGKGYMATSHFF